MAFHVNAQLSDLETEPTTVYKKATEEIEAVRSAKVNFLKKRIDENSTKLTAFRARLEKVEAKIATVEPVLDQARSAQSNGWAKAVRTPRRDRRVSPEETAGQRKAVPLPRV